MKLANRIKVTVFAKPEEDEATIREKFLCLFPFNLEEEKIPLKKSRATSFNQRQITIYAVELFKDRHINAFLKSIRDKLDEQQKQMLIGQENRLDENLDFFIRLDKQCLFNNQLQVTDCGDCFHIRISVAAFPREKEAALEVMKKIFS